MSDYNGWKNRETWNVMLWLDNDENLYHAYQAFLKDYKGEQPYLDFIQDCGLDAQKTPDGVPYASPDLDFAALNKAMTE